MDCFHLSQEVRDCAINITENHIVAIPNLTAKSDGPVGLRIKVEDILPQWMIKEDRCPLTFNLLFSLLIHGFTYHFKVCLENSICFG